MKINGKLIIPLVAIMIAMFTLGATPGFAGNTDAPEISESEATTVYDDLTYRPTTLPTEPPMEEQIEGFISGAVGEDLENVGDQIMQSGSVANAFLLSLRKVLNAFVRIFEILGNMMGNSNINLGLGGLLGK